MSIRSRVLRVWHVVLCVLLIALIVPFRVRAQDKTDCKIDLTKAQDLMTQAQAKAKSGDTEAALLLLDQVTQALDVIKSQCNTDGAIVLFDHFKEPNSIYTINYPKGWLTQAVPGPSSDSKGARPTLFTNDAKAIDMLASAAQNPNAQGVVVYVGTAKDVVTELGAFDSSKTYTQMDIIALLQAITSGQSTADGSFGKPQKTDSINDHLTAEVSFEFHGSKSTTATAKGTVLIMQLSDGQYAVFVSFAAPGNEESVAKLARKMASTLQLMPS
jgi:hypothetical protein